MDLKKHLIATGLTAVPLLAGTGIPETALFCSGAILIDLDHFIFYYLRTGRYDIRGMFRFFQEDVDRNLDTIPYLGVCIFHTVEFFLAIAVVAEFFPSIRFLLAGMLFHILLDIYNMIRLRIPFIRAYSLVEHFIRRRQPGYPFR